MTATDDSTQPSAAVRAPEARSTGVGLRSERGPVLVGIMLATSLVALDATIIATAVPSIVRDVGGFSQFPWLFSIYLLTQAVTTPLYGKVSDVVGRKPVLFLGIGVFLLGSVLCGVAWSMPSLIVARAVQGIGAGAVLPVTITVVGDLYSVQERAKVQGYIASVWGISAVVGPTLGGVFSDYLSWRWIFFVNLPLGALAMWMLWRGFHESVVRRRHRFDLLGAALLITGCSLVILGLLEGGVAWDWASPVSVTVFVVGALALLAFVLVERRAEEPVLPLWVFSRRVLVGGNLASMAVGVTLIGLVSYVPTYAQGVLGAGALEAGLALAAMTIGWPIAASLSGRVYLRIGFRDTALVGGAIAVVGTVLVALLGAGSSLLEVAGACFVVGVGLGLLSAPTIVAVQSVVDWQRRGVVTGTNMFCRNLGSALGVAVFGAIANATLASRFDHPAAAVAGSLPRAEDAERLALDGRLSGAVEAYVRVALNDAAHHVFVGVVVAAVLGALVIWLMPRTVVPLDAS
jgi:EmrB/QacA subfamily drug resistance transporter